MKRKKPNTVTVFTMGGAVAGYVDTRTWHFRKRWWTKARVPGIVRLNHLAGGSAFHPVRYGARKQRMLLMDL